MPPSKGFLPYVDRCKAFIKKRYPEGDIAKEAYCQRAPIYRITGNIPDDQYIKYAHQIHLFDLLVKNGLIHRTHEEIIKETHNRFEEYLYDADIFFDSREDAFVFFYLEDPKKFIDSIYQMNQDNYLNALKKPTSSESFSLDTDSLDNLVYYVRTEE